jgi:hypothetical protein
MSKKSIEKLSRRQARKAKVAAKRNLKNKMKANNSVHRIELGNGLAFTKILTPHGVSNECKRTESGLLKGLCNAMIYTGTSETPSFSTVTPWGNQYVAAKHAFGKGNNLEIVLGIKGSQGSELQMSFAQPMPPTMEEIRYALDTIFFNAKNQTPRLFAILSREFQGNIAVCDITDNALDHRGIGMPPSLKAA